MNRIPMAYGGARLFCAACIFVCLTQALALGHRSDPHRHRSQASLLSEIAPQVSFVQVSPPETAKRENLCKSRDGRFIAYTASNGTERLFIHDTRKRVVYEVRGIPLDYRPLSDLRWSRYSRLVFDRWSQPHHGMHYELDVRRKRLVAGYAFPG